MTEQNPNPNPNPDGTGNPAPVNVFDSLPPDLKGYVELKGFKSAEDVVKAYKSFETFQGVSQDRLLKLPEENDVDGINAMYDRLGRPKTAAEYKITTPQGQNDKFAKTMAPILHKAGLSQKQVDVLVNDWNVLQAQTLAENQKQIEANIAGQKEELQKEWGKDYDLNLENAKRAARIAGITPAEIDALEKATNYKTVMNVFAKISKSFSEDTLKGAGNINNANSFALSPAAAQAKIDELMSNKDWQAKMNGGDKAAIAEYKKLATIVAGGTNGK